jgi:acyl-CoA thioester hydrolase
MQYPAFFNKDCREFLLRFMAIALFCAMNQFTRKPEVRWADLDPNFHLRHSVYYDYGASCRVEFLNGQGITAQFMHRHQVGPILFREECVFKKEIRAGDELSINLTLLRARPDLSRWTIQHHIFKSGEILAAVITLEGAWMDLQKRKLTIPPGQVVTAFAAMPRENNFEWINTKI